MDGRAAMFEAAFFRSSVPITIATLAGAKLVEINPAACELLGVSRAEALGRTSPEMGVAIDEGARAAVTRILTEHGVIADYPYTVQIQGKPHWHSVSASIIDVDGEPCIMASIVDITDRRVAEEELRASEARFAAAFNQAGVIMVMTSLRDHGRVVDVNDAFLRQTGFTRAEVIGSRADSLGLFANPADQAAVIGALMTTGRVRNMEVAVKSPRAEQTHGLFSADVIRFNGEPHAIFTIVDLTERVAAEEQLRASELRYRNLVEQTADGVLVLAADGTIAEANPALCELVGRPRDDVIGKPWMSFIEAHNLEELPLVRPDLGDEPQVFERRVVRPDGSLVELEVHARRYQSGMMLGTAREIGARKAAERERARLIEAIEQSAEAILIVDPAGRIEYLNPTWARQTGWDRAVVGKHFGDLINGAREESYYTHLMEEAARQGPVSLELDGIGPDGKATHATTSISAVRDGSGEVVSYVAVRRDVTRERELEDMLRQSQKMEAVGRLAGGVAHDFNNLLTAISGFNELALAQAPADSEMADYLRQIRASAKRAGDLTRQLLTFGRRAATKLEVLDLNAVCEDIAPMLRLIIGEGIELTITLDAALRPILADRGQIEQVIVNLVVNARDAMVEDGRSDGRIEIGTSNVSVEAAQAQMDQAIPKRRDVRLAITDNGVGIDPEHLSLIWEPFFTTKPAGSGVGLGLATVFGIVRQAGGHVHVDSKPGRGSVFMVDLPAVDAAPAVDEPIVPAKPEPRGRETVLVVEDEPAVLGFAAQMLERNGYRVLRASNGKEAIDISLSHEGRIDVLFSDIVMPGLSGHDAALAIREHRPATRILLTSGYSEETNCLTGTKLDVPFLPKPYSTQELLGALRAALNGEGSGEPAAESSEASEASERG